MGGTFSGVTIFPPPHPKIGDASVECEDYFLPAVIIWNPYAAYPSIFPPGSILCNVCGGMTRLSYWNDGSSSSTQPRTLHDMHNVVLLVSAVHTCDSSHKLLAHDESVLQCFPTCRMIPFILLLKTGFTSDLVDTCTSLCVHGMNFYKIETFIQERRSDVYARQQELHQLQHTLVGDREICKFENSGVLKSPSNDLIAKVILAKFIKDENLYLTEITQIPVGESISFDHTFKVAANIGFRRDDGVWVPQYDSLFIVLNPTGKVLTWQLTKGTAFSQIGQLLTDLKHRASNLKSVYIDDCCKLRTKIHSIFGQEIMVKLDLFHAVKRISTTLPKKHPLIHQCTQDLQLVFRKDGDTGKQRTESTPEPDVMSSKLEKFVSRWKDIEDGNGKKVFTPPTFEAVRKLREHISAGCLSNIPPGGGTNRNERLHHHLNSLFTRTKIGILLAYAMLTLVIHSYNSSERRHGRRITKSIHSRHFQQPQIALKPIGILPKFREQDNVQSTDHWEIDVTENTLDMELIVSIFIRSLQKHHIMKILQAMGLTRMQKSSTQFEPFHSTSYTGSPDSNLREKLFDFGLSLQAVQGDGNCFFTSVSVNMLSNCELWKHCLTLAGADCTKVTLEDLSHKLRQAFVRELLGERRIHYEAFVAHTNFDYEEEAERFKDDKYFNSELGNTMPLTLATALQCTIIIFHNSNTTPTMYVTPDLVTTEATAFVVYTYCNGLGHYDAAIPCHQVSTSNEKPSRCSCGINKKDDKKNCSHNAMYLSRCGCFKLGKPCTHLCRCLNCNNPNGAHTPTQKTAERIKRKHAFQVELPKSKKIAEERGEALTQSLWSDFETIVLDEICRISGCYLV